MSVLSRGTKKFSSGLYGSRITLINVHALMKVQHPCVRITEVVAKNVM